MPMVFLIGKVPKGSLAAKNLPVQYTNVQSFFAGGRMAADGGKMERRYQNVGVVAERLY